VKLAPPGPAKLSDRQLKAAALVRRIIQKVRVATPENFSDLTVELSEELFKQAEELGDEEHLKLQDEADKGLIMGQKRVDQVLEKRQKEEEEAERPRELLKEYENLISDFEAKVAKCTEEWDPNSITLDDAHILEEQLKQHHEEFKVFTQEVGSWMKAHSSEFSKPTTLEVVKKEHQAMSLRAGLVIRSSNELRKSVEQESKKALEEAKLLRMARIKEELQYKLEDVSAPVSDAELLVKHMERLVEPFAKIRLPDEMDEQAEQVESAIEIAKESMSTARRATRPSDDLDVEESMKADVEAWLKGETKRYTIRAGQLDGRIARAAQLVAMWRKDVRKREEAKVLVTLKDEVVERAKALTAEEIMDPLEQDVQGAERVCQTLVVRGRPKVEDLRAMEDSAKAAITSAQAALKEAKQKLSPFDDSVGEKVKQELQLLIAPIVRAHELRLVQAERRVQRTEKLLENFQAELKKLNAARCLKVKSSITRLLRLAALGEAALGEDDTRLSPEDLFNHMDTDSDGSISQDEWLSFLEAAQETVRNMEVDKTLIPLLQLLTSDFLLVFDDICIGLDRAITKNTFLQLLPQYMQVLRATTMTEGINIATTKTIRQLRPGEYVEVIDGPSQDPNLMVDRFQVRAVEDDVVGWATMKGSGGSVYLKESSPPPTTN